MHISSGSKATQKNLLTPGQGTLGILDQVMRGEWGGGGVRKVRGLCIIVSVSRLILAKTTCLLLAWEGIC